MMVTGKCVRRPLLFFDFPRNICDREDIANHSIDIFLYGFRGPGQGGGREGGCVDCMRVCFGHKRRLEVAGHMCSPAGQKLARLKALKLDQTR